MKSTILFCVLHLLGASFVFSQGNRPDDLQRKEIISLIDQYSVARETKDTGLLKKILTTDVDQLVSTGEWRNGIIVAIQGMLKSSAASPGTRTLTVHKIKFVGPVTAMVDCMYEIQNTDNTRRKMWSSFLVISSELGWQISAIRNMLPAAN